MAFLENFAALQTISARCANGEARLVSAKSSIAIALADATAILTDNAAAIAVIEADIAADLEGDAAAQATAGMTNKFLTAARTKQADIVAKLTAARDALAGI